MPDSISPFERPLTHKSFFNIVYFSLISLRDVLHYIDFHQLQIENKQYVAKIEERNQELLKLKMTTGSTVQVS